MYTLCGRTARFIASPLFRKIVLGSFAFEAVWFAFSALYPMAFDEDFHFGLIRLYAEHWNPFFSAQPVGADQFGAVVRDPSFLYHYMMSFPYRLLRIITDSQNAQVIVLRLMNVAMAVYALRLYARVLRLAGVSAGFTNVALAVYALIPVAPQLAGQVNYDNLLMVLFALLCLAAHGVLAGARHHHINVLAWLFFIGICVYVSLVKYVALPFVLGVVAVTGVWVAVYFRHDIRRLPQEFSQGLRRANRRALWAGVILLVLGLVGFGQRYGVNLARYHTPVPSCHVVLGEQACFAYGPWSRDYWYTKAKPADFRPDIRVYTVKWLRGMWHRLYFAVNGKTSDFFNYLSLPLPGRTAIAVAVMGAVAAIVWLPRHIMRRPFLQVLLGGAAAYVIVLFVNGYASYARTGIAVAVNGRYLLPVLLPMAAAAGLALRDLFRRSPRHAALVIQPAMVVVALGLMLNGGGVLTFIMRSDNSWYMPNTVFQSVNNNVRRVLEPVIVDGRRDVTPADQELYK